MSEPESGGLQNESIMGDRRLYVLGFAGWRNLLGVDLARVWMVGSMTTAKYESICYGCGEEILVGMEIAYFGNGETYHKACEPRAGWREKKHTMQGSGPQITNLPRDVFLREDQ